MKNILRTILFISAFLGVSPAFAACTGQFPSNTFCGVGGSQGIPGPILIPPGGTTPINPGTVLGNPGPGTSTPVATSNPVLGVPGVNTGTLGFAGSSSGTATISAQAGAGAATLLLPTTSGTFPSSASAPLVLNAGTGVLTCPTCLTTTGSFANPTATVGFTAVNGVATTAMRSDAAPALNSSIYSITSAATTLIERDANQNAFANNFNSKATNVSSAGGTTVLTAASTRYQNLTGTLAQTFQLPDATTLNIGAQYQFNNNSTGLLTVTNNGGATIATVPAGGIAQVLAIVVSTANGSWDAHFEAPSNVQWGTSTLALGSAGGVNGTITLNGSTSGGAIITPQATAGTPTLTLPNTSGTFAVNASSPLILSPTTGNLSLNAAITPGVRITLTSATAIMTTSVSGATTVYVTPYFGNLIPIYDGTNFTPTPFAEVSQTTTDTTKSPAAVTTNSNYDIFCWVDTGPTNRCTRGPAWTNDTTRSAGTALVIVNGIYLNNASITNGPAALRGTYVGSIRSNGTSTIDYQFGAIAAGGTAASFGVWNINRVPVSTFVGDSTDSWTYTTANTWRAPNGNATMRVSAIRGLDIDGVTASYNSLSAAGAATTTRTGVGLDSTTAFSGVSDSNAATFALANHAYFSGLMGLGFHFLSALEYQNTTTSSTYFGDAGVPLQVQTGLTATLQQ